MNNSCLYIIETDDGETGRSDDWIPLFGGTECISRERKPLIPIVSRLNQGAKRFRWKARYRIAKWVRAKHPFSKEKERP